MNHLLKRIFRGAPRNTAAVAKERLQIIISHERSQRQSPQYLLAMKEEIVEVIARYIKIDKEAVRVQLEHTAGGHAVLELNVTMPAEQEQVC